VLTPTQYAHLRMIVLAIGITYGRKSLGALKEILPAESHHTNLCLFLRYNWDAEILLDIVAREQLNALDLSKKDILYLIIDDTKVKKRGKKMKALHKVKDPATGRYFQGHTFVAATLLARGVTIPFRIKTFLSAGWRRRKKKPYRKLTDLASNDRTASASRIIDRYLYRWSIEVFFKDAKQLLGLTHYQCLDIGAINRHVHLVALAYALLTHLRLRASGAKGKPKKTTVVSRDATRKRQADLRNLVMEDSISVLLGKSKRNKSLQKITSLLKAA